MIDVSKGRGLVLHGEGTGASAAHDVPAVPGERRARPRIFVTELDRARKILESSKAAVTQMFGEARLGRAISFDLAMPLVEEIAASVQRDASAMLKVTRLKSKNEYTYMHSVAVCALMINFARHLGLPEHEVRDVGMAGMLHDIGKMATPLEVLDKPGALTDAEMQLIRDHPLQGHAMIADSPGIGAAALDVCLHHHERYDGKGYPFGLTGEQLSLHARMSAICDVYDAVTSDRPYKRPWSPNEALARMLEWEGHFDPGLLDSFIASLGIPPLGSLVRLRSNRLALVTGAAPADPSAPSVRAFYAVETPCFVPPEDLTTGEDGDPVIRLEKGSYWFGNDWPAIKQLTEAGKSPA
jgi:putative nucleotidyltransferase with HDIG domain